MLVALSYTIRNHELFLMKYASYTLHHIIACVIVVVTSSYTTTIAHAILWCNVYDAYFIRNSSWLRIVYDKATNTNV